MDVTSLGYRTDLMVLLAQGSEVADLGDCTVVRSPANPAFWWGNFVLFPGPPPPAAAAGWLARFSAELPGASHVALGVDVTGTEGFDAGEFLTAGLTLNLDTVLTASAVREPAHRCRAACYRPLASDEDWRQAARLRLSCNPGQDRAFLKRRITQARTLAEGLHGTWFGAFLDGRLLCHLGLVGDGGPLARFQDVETHPAARRQGLAGSLVHHAARYGLAQMGAATLVIVADPGDAAIRLYRSVGFADREVQVGLERQERGEGQNPGERSG